MKKIVTLVVTLLLIVACQESSQERFEREAKEFTEQHCPQELAQDIRLDSVSFSKAQNTYYYYYTLSGGLEQQAMTDSTAGEEQRKFLLNGVCNDVSTKLEKEAKVTFHYIYRTTTGKAVWDFVFKHEDYTNVTPERPETPREKLARETAEFTAQHCPKDIGQGQRLDSLSYNITTNALTHHYTLAGKHVTPQYMAERQAEIRQKLLSDLKTEKSLEAMRKLKVDFVYEFKSAITGQQVLLLNYEPQDYE